MIAPENSIPVEVLDAAINAWFGTVPESKDQQEFFRNRMRAALAAAGYPTAPADGDARDAERLDFLANHGAYVAWSKDRECCAVFLRDNEGNSGPMTKWGENWLTAREAIDAAIAAQQSSQGGK